MKKDAINRECLHANKGMAQTYHAIAMSQGPDLPHILPHYAYRA